MEKNAGKIMIMIDKPRERTASALGVSLRTVDKVYLESLAPSVHIYYTVNTHGLYIHSPEQFNTHKYTPIIF